MKKHDMLHKSWWMILLIFLTFLAGSSVARQSDMTAFINVTVIPMDSSYTLPDFTVLIGKDKIIDMGPTGTVEIPENTQRIDGHGKYLMPGLADMHVHTFLPGWFELEMIMFIANGVTTVRNMYGEEPDLELREQIKTGSLFGPTYYTTGPIIDGNPPAWWGMIVPTSPNNARQIVKQQADLGYDFIKIYDNLSKSIYDAIISEANAQNIPVVGHVPWFVGLEYVLKSGQKSIEHFKGHMDFFGYPWPQIAIWEEIDSTRINYFISRTLQSKAWNCPTLAVWKNEITDDEYDQAVLDHPYLKYVPDEQIESWRPDPMSDELRNRRREIRKNVFLKHLLKSLHEHGAKILLGTDCLNPFTVPGFSIHEELQLFVEAGLTPYDAIKAGTYYAAEFFKALDEFGTVTVGKRADLILINGNPLDDVQNIQTRVGVMVRGKWYTEAQLQDSLKKVENTWHPTGVIANELNGQATLDFTLFQNYPNPFNPTTTIRYEVPQQLHVRLTIYDVLGREVKTLRNRTSQPGTFEITWDGTDEFDNPVAGGVYFCRMEAEKFVKSIKLAFVR